MVVGIRRNKPALRAAVVAVRVRLPPVLDGRRLHVQLPQLILHHEVPFPSIGDAIYLTVYPAADAGAAAARAPAQPARNRNTLIDAAIITLGLALLSWVLQIAPYLHDSTISLLPKLVSVAYPMGDIIMLAAGDPPGCSTAAAARRPST